MNLLRIAHTPPVVISPDVSVFMAVEKMVAEKVGAVAVIEDSKIIGIFTERDLMKRLVLDKRSVLDTKVRDVMTPNPVIARKKMSVEEAFHLMDDDHFRHMPLVDENEQVIGMLSVRHLMREIAELFRHDAEGLSAYISADGIGG